MKVPFHVWSGIFYLVIFENQLHAMPLVTLSKIERRRLTMFFICLALALGAWLFFAFSNRYVYQAKTVVHYTGLPQNKAFHPLQADTVTLQIEGTGWQLLFSKLRISPPSVSVNLSRLSKQNFISFSDQLSEINRQLESNQKVVYVQPDTLYFDFSTRSVKKVPIELVQNILFKTQYGISGKIRLLPEYVTISGPFEDIQNIKTWQTEKLELKDVRGTVTRQVSLTKPEKANIDVFPSSVEVTVPVEEFTETTLEVPLKLMNAHNLGTVKLLPEKVKVRLMAALSNFPQIDKNDFSLSVDMDNWRTKGYQQLPVHLMRTPQYIKVISVEPQVVDYIITR